MRVLLANKYFFLKGGAERALFDIDAALGALGHEVVHFAMKHPLNRPSPWQDAFVSEVSYDRPGLDAGTLRGLSRFFWSEEVRRAVRELVERARPDVALLNNVYHQLGPALILELDRQRVPMLMLLHDYKVSCPAYSLYRQGGECRECAGGRFHSAARNACGGSRARGLVLAAESHWQWRVLGTYARIRRFAAPSRFLAETVRSMGFPFEIALLPNAVTVPAEPADPGAARAVGYAGRLSAEKGVDWLLEAAALAPELELRIVGDGPARAELERRARALGRGNVTFLGHLSSEALEREIRRWRAAVVPSVWPENCPYAVLEPQAHGVPVVASAVGGIPEIVRGGGILVPPRDTAALARALRDLVADRERARELGRLGREHMAAAHAPDIYRKRLDALLCETEGGTRGGVGPSPWVW